MKSPFLSGGKGFQQQLIFRVGEGRQSARCLAGRRGQRVRGLIIVLGLFAEQTAASFRLHDIFDFLVREKTIVRHKYMHDAVSANIKEIPVIILIFAENFPAGLVRVLLCRTFL